MASTVQRPETGQEGQGPLAPESPESPASEYLSVILESLNTMKNGDFCVRLPVAWTGLAGRIADNFNEIVATNERMALELKRVGQAVGKEGRTRERIRLERRRGAWDEMEVSVNTLVEDLLRPTNEVTRAIAAVAQGNLTQTVRLDVDGRPLEGEFLRSANIVNTMIQQLGIFTAEVTRVAREVGTDGKLGGQAVVPGRGRYLEGSDRLGELDGVEPDGPGAKHRRSGDRRGVRRSFAQNHGGRARRNSAAQRSHQHDGGPAAVVRIGSDARGPRSGYRRQAGRPGGGARRGRNVEGSHRLVNAMAGNLTAQVRNIAEVTTAVARGDLSRKITVDVKGEILELKDTINTMVDQLNAFAGEVTRVAREVGTEGKLGGQASVPGVAGTWKDLTDNVNFMAGNLTGQVRNIAEVATAIANGDLSPQDHGGRARRNSAAERNAEHHGGPAEPVRRRSDARGPRSGNGRTARRTGQRARRGRYVEGFDGLGQFDGRQPDGAGDETSPK